MLYGGISAEREVSLSSGVQVIAALRGAGLRRSTPIEVGDDLAAVIAALTPRPDAVFNALHGRFGEDGAIQGVLDWLAIPYTHSGVLASALAMDKAAAKAVFAAAGLPVAQGRCRGGRRAGGRRPAAAALRRQAGQRRFLGRRRHHPPAATTAAPTMARAWRFGRAAMVEEYIPGRELTVGVMGERALAVTEILAEAGVFYDYDSKYGDGGSRHIIPAAVHPEHLCARAAISRWRRIARWAAAAPSRCDFRYDDTAGEPGRLVLLEVNTQPGLTPTSLLPEQAAHLRHRLSRAVRLDGGARRMPRVTRQPRNSINDRPAPLRLRLRRGWQKLRPAGWLGIGVVLLLGAAWRATRPLRRRVGWRRRRRRRGPRWPRCASASAMRPPCSGCASTASSIEGRANTPEPLLRAALGISKGDPILGFSLDAARRNVEKLAWVEQATVERRLPDTIVVQLVERRAVRHLAEPGPVRADRPRRPGGRPTRTSRNSVTCRWWSGPGAPAAATALIDRIDAISLA